MTRVARWVARAVAVVCAGTVLFAGSDAFAGSDDARCSVYEVKASNGDKPHMDKALKPLAKKLGRGPFRAWNVFNKLAIARNVAVARMTAKRFPLKPGGQLSVLYRSLSQSKGKKDRLRLSLTMDNKRGKRALDTTIELDSKDFFLVGGQALPDKATYILAISCEVK